MGMVVNGQDIQQSLGQGLEESLQFKPHLGQCGWSCSLPAVGLRSSEAPAQGAGRVAKQSLWSWHLTWHPHLSWRLMTVSDVTEEGWQAGRRPQNVIDVVLTRSIWDHSHVPGTSLQGNLEAYVL